MAVLFFSVILLLPLFSFLLLRWRRSKKLNLPPGPPKLPIIGNLHQLGSITHRTLSDLSKRYGPLMHLQLGTIPALIISSSELAKEVLKTQDAIFCSRPPLITFGRFFSGSGVATAPHGDSWRELRKIYIHELFSSKKLDSYHPVRAEEVERMVRSISSDGEVAVNLSELMIALNYNIVSRVAFGRSGGGDGREYANRSKFDWLLEEAQALMAGFFAEDYFPAWRWIDVLSGQRRRLDRCAEAVDEFLREVIGEHMEAGNKGGREEDIVDLLLRLHKEGQVTMNQIKGSIMDIFSAGTETSAATVTWAMTELMRNPSTMKKAQEEVRMLVGKKGKVEENDIPQLLYLKLVVKEALRLHPPAPLLIPHEVVQHCKINNYDVLPKTRVLVNVWAISREEDSWRDPHEFIPERFEGSLVDFKGQDFQFLPFGSGRRICPGMYFGLSSVEIILANILYIFDWELLDGMRIEDIDMSEAPGIASHKKSKLCLVAKRYI